MQDLNVRLIGVHGLSFDFANGSLCITNIGSRSNLPGSPGSWVDPPGGPGLAGFLYLPIFLLISGPVQSLGRPISRSSQSGFNNYVQ